jgi:hypothetical protein
MPGLEQAGFQRKITAGMAPAADLARHSGHLAPRHADFFSLTLCAMLQCAENLSLKKDG